MYNPMSILLRWSERQLAGWNNSSEPNKARAETRDWTIEVDFTIDVLTVVILEGEEAPGDRAGGTGVVISSERTNSDYEEKHDIWD